MLEYLKRPKILIGLLLIIGGLDISVLTTKLPRLAGLVFLFFGAVLVYSEYAKIRKEELDISGGKEDEKRKKLIKNEKKTPRLSERIIHKFTLNGRLIPFLWLIGIMIISFDLILNLTVAGSSFGSFDLIFIGFGVALILYAPLVKKYHREMDFITIFLALIIIILIIPLRLDSSLEGGSNGGFEQGELVNVLLAQPLSAILTLIGIENTASGPYIGFVMADGNYSQVGIAASCAGIYSLGIFLAAFISFVLSEYAQLSRRIAILLAIGVFFTYLANLFRMTIIVLAGHYNGIGTPSNPEPFTLLWTHQYAGEIIFICWVALFWWITFKYFAVDEETDQIEADVAKSDEKIETPSEHPTDNEELKEEAP